MAIVLRASSAGCYLCSWWMTIKIYWTEQNWIGWWGLFQCYVITKIRIIGKCTSYKTLCIMHDLCAYQLTAKKKTKKKHTHTYTHKAKHAVLIEEPTRHQGCLWLPAVSARGPAAAGWPVPSDPSALGVHRAARRCSFWKHRTVWNQSRNHNCLLWFPHRTQNILVNSTIYKTVILYYAILNGVQEHTWLIIQVI